MEEKMKVNDVIDDSDIINLNEEEDTLYFTDIDKEEYEIKDKIYTESDMIERYIPLTNLNSVEYDDGDYASPLYGIDREESEKNKNFIFIYIFSLLVIVLIGAVIISFV